MNTGEAIYSHHGHDRAIDRREGSCFVQPKVLKLAQHNTPDTPCFAMLLLRMMPRSNLISIITFSEKVLGLRFLSVGVGCHHSRLGARARRNCKEAQTKKKKKEQGCKQIMNVNTSWRQTLKMATCE